ncbi:MAG: DUF4861 family protein [Chthoniobacteraceae bacterium]
MISSGVDVWCKRVPYLIVNRWYTKSLYHEESGEGLDMYDTGKTRGCGGTGIWDGKTLAVSHNWIAWKVLANGPVRTVFEAHLCAVGRGQWPDGERDEALHRGCRPQPRPDREHLHL